MTNAQNYFKENKDSGIQSNKYYGNPKRVDESLLPQVTLESLGFTVEAVKSQLLGMDSDLVNPATGEPYPDSFYESMIEQAVANTEKELDLTIRPRVTSEAMDYNQTEYNSYMFLRTSERPIIQVDELAMSFNNRPIMKYPDPWIKVTHRFGQLEIQPTLLMQMGDGLQLSNITMNGGLIGLPQATTPFGGTPMFSPQMIWITYASGMLPMPASDRGINRGWYVHPDLVAYVAKKATIEVLERWGRLILGAGIAGYGISVDGISTQVDSTQSAENTGSTADIKLLQADMKDIKNNLTAYYGLNIGVLS